MVDKKVATAKTEEPTKASDPSTEVVATTTGTDLVESDDDFFENAGEGLEDFSQSDMLIPYVRIIQALSKELQKNHSKYIQGAEQGTFVNSATRKLYGGEKGFYAIPVSFGHRYMAWRPNNAGPAHDYGDDSTVYNSITEDDKYKRIDADGNEVTDSMQFFVILVDKETFEYEIAVLTFGGSQSKKSRGWSTIINNRQVRNPKTGALMRPAIYFFAYDVTTQPESNEQGSWYGFSITEAKNVMDLTHGKEIYRTAKELRERITAGEVKAAVEDPRSNDEEDSTKAF